MFRNEPYQTHLGDCLEVMRGMDANSVDAIVTDPPYGLRFMGKDWDHGIPGISFWEEAIRMAKPGAHLLACGGTRTFHRLACAIEDAGWEIRDCVMWVYGSGFPKSADVSKMIDKAAGADRERIGSKIELGIWHSKKGQPGQNDGWRRPWMKNEDSDAYHVTAPATDAARQWSGWGTALKPAWEPILVCRKPLDGPVAANVLKWGTGAINVDGCRVGSAGWIKADGSAGGGFKTGKYMGIAGRGEPTQAFGIRQSTQGRWPANLIHDGSEEVVALFPMTTSRVATVVNRSNGVLKHGGINSRPSHGTFQRTTEGEGYNDTGSAARFFYCAKASKADRDTEIGRNHHPTVKPIALMEYFITLVTREGQVVLDPFMGSGSTGVAAINLNRTFIGIEQDAEYLEIARRRLCHHEELRRQRMAQLGLPL